MITMTQMIEETATKYNEIVATKNRQPHAVGKTFEVESVGKVWCGLQIVQGRSTWMRPHFRRNWELNGKRISAEKLAKIIPA